MTEDRCFKYRVVGIARQENRVLLYNTEGKHFWALPGGRVDFGEFSHQALKREFLEETGFEIEVGELIWVSEHLFTRKDGEEIHEIALYYPINFKQDSKALQVESFHGDEKGMKLTFRWVKLEELEELVFYPKFLCDMLAGPHTGIHHLIHNSGFDDSTGLT